MATSIFNTSERIEPINTHLFILRKSVILCGHVEEDQ